MMKKIRILGYRFGIYGYLPALVESGYKNIFISEKGKDFFSKIEQLSHLEKFITWDKEEIRGNYFDIIILTLPPKTQYQYIIDKSILSRSKNFILEKPIAPTPQQSLSVIQEIIDKKINYKVNYSFLYTKWYLDIRNKILKMNKDSKVKILWDFKAYHFQYKIDNWKQDNSLGGGAIRFYGIHIIAFLSSLGYLNVKESIGYNYYKDIIYKWEGSFSKNELLPNIDLTLNSDANHNLFRISYNKNNKEHILLNLNSPFQKEDKIELYDQRVSPLIHFIENKNPYFDITFQKNLINLWQCIEDKLILIKKNKSSH